MVGLESGGWVEGRVAGGREGEGRGGCVEGEGLCREFGGEGGSRGEGCGGRFV